MKFTNHREIRATEKYVLNVLKIFTPQNTLYKYFPFTSLEDTPMAKGWVTAGGGSLQGGHTLDRTL